MELAFCPVQSPAARVLEVEEEVGLVVRGCVGAVGDWHDRLAAHADASGIPHFGGRIRADVCANRLAR